VLAFTFRTGIFIEGTILNKKLHFYIFTASI